MPLKADQWTPEHVHHIRWQLRFDDAIHLHRQIFKIIMWMDCGLQARLAIQECDWQKCYVYRKERGKQYLNWSWHMFAWLCIENSRYKMVVCKKVYMCGWETFYTSLTDCIYIHISITTVLSFDWYMYTSMCNKPEKGKTIVFTGKKHDIIL